MILKRGWLQILLAAALAIAQYGALMHQTRHLHDRLPQQTQPLDHKQKSAHAGLCDFHVSFAQVLGAASCMRTPLQLAVNAVERVANHFPPAFAANRVVPASRGPPILL